MTLAVRAVLETGRGRAWTWPERERLADFLAEHGFNLYIYAPRHDPLRRERWREPYLPEEVERFARLAQRCAAGGVVFCFGVRPVGCNPGDPAAVAALWDKLAPLQAAGVRSFLIEGEGGSGEAALAGALLQRLRAAAGPFPRLVGAAERPTQLLFQPTSSAPAYLRALGACLDPAVGVLWPAPAAPTIGLRAVRAASQALRRPVLVLDPYPGGAEEAGLSPHLRPLRGREAALDAAAVGLVLALGPLPEAARIPLHTFAAWAADPAGYDPELAWEHALAAVCGDLEDASAAGNLGHLARCACLEPGPENPLAPKLAQFWQRWGGAPPAAGPDLPGLPPAAGAPGRGLPLERQAAIAVLVRELTRLRWKAERLLGRPHNPHLQAELQPWAQKLLGWVEAAEAGLELLRLALVDPADARLPALRERLVAQCAELRQDPYAVADDHFEQFCRRCLWAAAALAQAAHA